MFVCVSVWVISMFENVLDSAACAEDVTAFLLTVCVFRTALTCNVCMLYVLARARKKRTSTWFLPFIVCSPGCISCIGCISWSYEQLHAVRSADSRTMRMCAMWFLEHERSVQVKCL